MFQISCLSLVCLPALPTKSQCGILRSNISVTLGIRQTLWSQFWPCFSSRQMLMAVSCISAKSSKRYWQTHKDLKNPVLSEASRTLSVPSGCMPLQLCTLKYSVVWVMGHRARAMWNTSCIFSSRGESQMLVKVFIIMQN